MVVNNLLIKYYYWVVALGGVARIPIMLRISVERTWMISSFQFIGCAKQACKIELPTLAHSWTVLWFEFTTDHQKFRLFF